MRVARERRVRERCRGNSCPAPRLVKTAAADAGLLEEYFKGKAEAEAAVTAAFGVSPAGAFSLAVGGDAPSHPRRLATPFPNPTELLTELLLPGRAAQAKATILRPTLVYGGDAFAVSPPRARKRRPISLCYVRLCLSGARTDELTRTQLSNVESALSRACRKRAFLFCFFAGAQRGKRSWPQKVPGYWGGSSRRCSRLRRCEPSRISFPPCPRSRWRSSRPSTSTPSREPSRARPARVYEARARIAKRERERDRARWLFFQRRKAHTHAPSRSVRRTT